MSQEIEKLKNRIKELEFKVKAQELIIVNNSKLIKNLLKVT